MSAASDTIYALSSAAGRAGVAVVRVSGPGAGVALTALAGRLPEPRRATLRQLQQQSEAAAADKIADATAASGTEAIDQALVLWFPAPASYTGEDMAELHVHGGRAVIEAVLAALGAQAGLRLAEPGEFTRRAFLNGKLDLAQAEAVADLIAAADPTPVTGSTAATAVAGRRRSPMAPDFPRASPLGRCRLAECRGEPDRR